MGPWPMTDRLASSSPGAPEAPALTCQWCRERPATHLLVYDYRPRNCPQGVTDRLKALVCGLCARRDERRGWP